MIRAADRLDMLRQDLRHTFRSLWNAPGFTLATISVLALGIGANLAIFTVLNTVLLRPLPYAEPDRLVQLKETFPVAGGTGDGSVSYPNYADWRAQTHSFTDLVFVGFPQSMNVQGGDRPERLRGMPVGASLFGLLGVRPMIGRTFVQGEDGTGAGKVVVLSHELWRARFGSNPNVIGETLLLDGDRYTVIGVMSEGFRFPASRSVDLWTPFQLTPDEMQKRDRHYSMVFGRLKPGVTVDAAAADVQRVARALEQQYPKEQEGRSVKVQTLHEATVGYIRPTLIVLLGAAGLVLLIACANAASLLLARAVARRREVAIRAALGAVRGRIMGQFLTESLILAAAGALGGVLLARTGLHAILDSASRILPRATDVSFDARVVGFLLVTTLATALLFGVVPGLQAAGTDPQQHLREGGRTGSSRRGNAFRNTLVVGQIALSLVLLVGAGLLMRTFLALVSTNPGMDTTNVLTFHTPVSLQQYEVDGDASPVVPRFYKPMLERVRAIPGVRDAGLISHLPLQSYGFNGNFGILGRTFATKAEEPWAEYRVVSPGYFAAMGIRVARGRDFAESDDARAAPVVIVNRTLADLYFRNEDVVGRQLTDVADSVPVTIVGVVNDVHNTTLAEKPRAEIYVPYDQAGGSGAADAAIVVRADVAATSLTRGVEAAVHAVNPDQPIYNVKTMQEVVRESVSDRQLYMWLLGVFAGVALLLAVAGIYGVISYSVSQRTREFGIRLTLGSDTTQVSRMVMLQGARLALWGVLIGVPTAFALTRLLRRMLYGVSAADPVTFAVVALALGAVALLASYIPARRIARLDPIVALRAE